MALREIGAKLTLDGEAEWKSQMNAVNRELKTVKSELAANSAEFAGCANSAEALRSKQALLQTQYTQQKEKIRALTQALADMEEAGQGNTKKADDLRVSLNYAKVAASKTSTEIDDLAGYLEEAENSADGCATSIDGFGNKVKDAGDSAGDAGDKSGTLKEALSELVPGFDKVTGVLSGTGGTVALLGGVGAALGAAFNWAMNLVEETEELRTSLAKLNATAETLGVSVNEDLTENLVDLYAVADGDWDSAFEALQNLLNAGYDDSLPEIINLLAGAVESFPDTMKIESLADSLQETLATGSATGQFSELLGRLGVNVDTFNAKLAACNTEAEKQNLVYQTLTEEGLADVAEAYKEANSESLALTEAEANLELANADLAESFVPLKTKITEAKTWLAGFLTNVLEGTSHGGVLSGLTVALQSGAAAGDEAGVSMSELWDIMDEGGYTFDTLRDEAYAAGMNMGEYVNTLRDARDASENADTATGNLTAELGTLESKLGTARTAWQNYQAAMQNIGATTVYTPSYTSGTVVNSAASSSLIYRQHKSGLDYVPYDGYLASLHYGERVLTAEENRAYSNNYATNLGGVAITVNAAQGQSAEEIARAVSKELWREAERNNAVYGRSYL